MLCSLICCNSVLKFSLNFSFSFRCYINMATERQLFSRVYFIRNYHSWHYTAVIGFSFLYEIKYNNLSLWLNVRRIAFCLIILKSIKYEKIAFLFLFLCLPHDGHFIHGIYVKYNCLHQIYENNSWRDDFVHIHEVWYTE